MTIDTSALLAILLDEPERVDFITRIEAAAVKLISTASVLEASMVLITRKGPDAETDLELFLHRAGIKKVPFDDEQMRVAQAAFRRYGKGRHAAGLNFGDCIVYALAQWSGEPLLYKGADFGLTDVARAVA